MRIIDADILKKHYAWWGDYNKDLFDDIVDQQKTIDAIPVKWIIKWSAEHMTEFGTLTVERMLEDWRKSVEQSSKDAVKKTS